jgi:hypothetical protein
MGALVADSTLSLVQSFERNSLATLCKDSITAGLCDADDIKGYLMPKVRFWLWFLFPERIHVAVY